MAGHANSQKASDEYPLRLRQGDVRHVGSDVMVAVKAKMREYRNQAEMVEGINTIEDLFNRRFPQTAWIFFEPDTRA